MVTRTLYNVIVVTSFIVLLLGCSNGGDNNVGMTMAAVTTVLAMRLPYPLRTVSCSFSISTMIRVWRQLPMRRPITRPLTLAINVTPSTSSSAIMRMTEAIGFTSFFVTRRTWAMVAICS